LSTSSLLETNHSFALGIRGANIGLEEKLDEVFASELEIKGEKYPALVPKNEQPALLESYYEGLAK